MAENVPIEGEAGIGYVIRHGYDLPPLMFTREEIAALTLGTRIINSWADPKLALAAQSVLSKVETVLPDSLKGELDQTKLFSPLVQIPAQVAAFMGELRSAVDHCNKVVITYVRADGVDSNRIIWTLGAWCELRQAFRNFRLDRIEKLQVCDERYPNEPGQMLEDMIAYEKKRMNDETL